MALNLKNPEVERLAEEVATLTASSKTEAIRQALLEKKHRLQASAGHDPSRGARQFLQDLWSTLPPEASRKLSKKELDAIL
jgi:antitoxin VapB